MPEEVGRIRIQEYAVGIFPTLPSRKKVKKAIVDGFVLVDGMVAKTAHWVKPGQRIELLEPEEIFTRPVKAYEMDLEVVYEDDHIAVVNKPGGIPVSGNQFRTIQNTLHLNLKESSEPDALTVFRPVHRLDGPTCGLLLIAKTATSVMELGQQFEKRLVKKRYRAVVIGEVNAQGRIETLIEEKPAVSEYRLVRTVRSIRNKYLSMVDLFPHTGRTHQLRIHMAGLDHPILGDKIYGVEGEIMKGKGLFLCAAGLSFTHPFTRESVDLNIETPYKFGRFMDMEQKRWERMNADTAPKDY